MESATIAVGKIGPSDLEHADDTCRRVDGFPVRTVRAKK